MDEGSTGLTDGVKAQLEVRRLWEAILSVFSFDAIDRAGKALAKFDGIDERTWAAMDESARAHYRREAKKILEGATCQT